MATETAYQNAATELAETGLDLLDFPTMIFYETGYSLHTLRQASRRSWRIGQHKPVRVLFFFYEGTFQERCVQLMGKKMLVAMAMEGKFSGEGLNSMGDEDMMTSLARELVEQGHVGESANQIWRDLRDVRQRIFDESAPKVGDIVPTPSVTDLNQMFADVPAVEEPEVMIPEVSFIQGEVVITPAEVVSPNLHTPTLAELAPVLQGLAEFARTPARRKRAAAIVCPDQMLLFAA